MDNITVTIDGKEYKVAVEEAEDNKLRIHFEGETFIVETKEDIDKEITDLIEKKETKGESIIRAPLPGVVFSINAKIGDVVKKGQTLIKLVAMKMENDITANKDGVVKEIKVKKNDNVNKDDILVVIE